MYSDSDNTYKQYNLYTEKKFKRTVIFEKYICPNYIDKDGNSFWIDRYGDITKCEDKDGNSRWFPTSSLIGRKGEEFLQAGYVYAPYIPMQEVQTIYDPNDFQPKKGIMSRYAKTTVNNKFYGIIEVTGNSK